MTTLHCANGRLHRVQAAIAWTNSWWNGHRVCNFRKHTDVNGICSGMQVWRCLPKVAFYQAPLKAPWLVYEVTEPLPWHQLCHCNHAICADCCGFILCSTTITFGDTITFARFRTTFAISVSSAVPSSLSAQSARNAFIRIFRQVRCKFA